MKKIIVIAGVTVLFFLVGAFGMYMSMPRLFPDRVPAADVLTPDSLALEIEADSIAAQILAGASLPGALSDSTMASRDDSTMSRALPRVIHTLRDSLADARQTGERLLAERDSALARIRSLEARLAGAIIPDGDATELSKTLASMGEKEMRPILERISDNALAALYHTASPRNKRTLMAAMPPDRAVRLVQQHLAASEAPAPVRDLAPDSSAIQ